MNPDIMMLEIEYLNEGTMWWDSKHSIKNWPEPPIKKWFGTAKKLYLYMGTDENGHNVVAAVDRKPTKEHHNRFVLDPNTAQLLATGTPTEIWEQLMAHARMMTACADREVV